MVCADLPLPSTITHLSLRFGDMNYRVNLPIKTILDTLPSRNFKSLLKADQLIKQRNIGNAFFAFGTCSQSVCYLSNVLQ